MTSLTAAIVTVGTEITDGQIVDRNSSWLSQKLQALDIKTLFHISVPDDTPLMLTAFQKATQTADLIFICGGLGPTVDDFTRNVIAEFAGQPLELSAEFFKIIEQKITSRGLPVREGHINQALFPRGALGIQNDYGVRFALIVLNHLANVLSPCMFVELLKLQQVKHNISFFRICFHVFIYGEA